MQVSELQKLVTNILNEYKAEDIIELDVRKMTDVTDVMIVCSGTSRRHIQTLAERVVEGAKHSKVQPLGVEGVEYAEWILIDLADVVVHIMQPKVREFYNLEKLWVV